MGVSPSCPVQLAAEGLIKPEWCFDHQRGVLAQLPREMTEADATRRELRLHQEGPLEIYYAPVDIHVNRAAKVVIVRITAGRHQAFLALQQAQRYIAQDDDETL